MTWSCTASHFFGGSFGSTPHFYGRSFRVWLHFYGRTYSNPKMHKHEENTKKRRRKHERYTQFCVFSSQQRTESSGENSPLIYEKISGLNWTTESKGSKCPGEIKGSKWTFSLVDSQPHRFVPRWHEVTNFIAGCDEVALKNATS